MFQKITPKSKDSAKWYEEVVEKAGLAEHSPVKGCMTIKPYGYAIWEQIQKILDARIKELGVDNTYFPIFIPKSFLEKEKEHIKGFAPECIVATEGGGKKLEEPLVLRPTSETIIYDSFARWIHSYRDLPFKINQWANIIRWEKRPRLFLRTIEFLWQEGHTAHENINESIQQANEVLKMYQDFANKYLAIATISGKKSDSEKFAGAQSTLCIEGLMSDGKALQMGTSHVLGQNFAKVFGIKYLDKNGKEQFVWQTSWGVSTRLIGAVILAHGDDKGLVLPPKIAPYQLVIIPIWKSDLDKNKLKNKIDQLVESLADEVRVKVDWRDKVSPGFKFNDWELKGVPLRIEFGPRDLEKNQAVLAERVEGKSWEVKWEDLGKEIKKSLDIVQNKLLMNNQDFLGRNEHEAENYDELKKILKEKGGFVKTAWCGSSECEKKIKDDTGATLRVIVGRVGQGEPAYMKKCICCGKDLDNPKIDHYPSYFAKAY